MLWVSEGVTGVLVGVWTIWSHLRLPLLPASLKDVSQGNSV